MRYLVYARKSSESEDRQIQSIEDQLTSLRRLATGEGLLLVGEHLESHSAKNPNSRPVFDEVLSRIEKGEADGILCWNINRLSRNPIDSGRLSWLLQRGVIKSIRTIEREYRPEDNVLLLAVESGVANQYIIDLRKAVARGLRGRVERGWWYGKPPPGYRTNPETKEIVIEPTEFTLLRRAWELAMSGSYSVPQILDRLDSWGFRRRIGRESKPLSRSALYRIFQNPFYHGWFYFKGEFCHGRHEPMVTRLEFEQVQRVLNRDTRPNPGPEPFLFGGVLRCAVCGCMITGERKIKNYKTTGRSAVYVYYRCTGARGCSKAGVREAEVIRRYIAALQELILPSWLYEPLEQVLKELKESNQLTDEEILGRQRENLRDLKLKLERLLEMRLGGELTSDEFLPRKNEVVVEMDRLERAIGQTADRLTNLTATLQTELKWFQRSYDQFLQASDFDEQREVVRYFQDEAFLTLDHLEIRPNTLMSKVIATFEPQKGGECMVQKRSRISASSIRRAVRDVIRTLLTGSEINCEYGVGGDNRRKWGA